MYFVYIVRCKDASSYTGCTCNVRRRLLKHSSGKGALFTRKKTPVKLVYCKKFSTKLEAEEKERQIKGWSRNKKENLIKYGKPFKS